MLLTKQKCRLVLFSHWLKIDAKVENWRDIYKVQDIYQGILKNVGILLFKLKRRYSTSLRNSRYACSGKPETQRHPQKRNTCRVYRQLCLWPFFSVGENWIRTEWSGVRVWPIKSTPLRFHCTVTLGALSWGRALPCQSDPLESKTRRRTFPYYGVCTRAY